MENMKQQAIRFGTTYVAETVTAVDFSKAPYALTTDTGITTATSVIIATGASAKWLGLPNEQRLRGKGVSACATCDGFFFKNKEVVVVGGGDAAMEEATFLTKFASKVTILNRTDVLRASKAMIHRATSDPKIAIRYNVSVLDVLGEQTISGVRLKDTVTGVEEEMACQGMFLAIGHQPNTKIFEGQLALVGPGYLQVENQVSSSKPGVFIAGDVADWRYRQAITAAGWGCMAALEAEKYLAGLEA
jgi:thioredoxin reductase (NADPH)